MTEAAGSDTFAETGVSPEQVAAAMETPAAARSQQAQRPMAPIVPGQNIAARALIFVIAIMTFLSCLTLGAVTLVRGAASTWEGQISREATIQIKPRPGLDKQPVDVAPGEQQDSVRVPIPHDAKPGTVYRFEIAVSAGDRPPAVASQRFSVSG